MSVRVTSGCSNWLQERCVQVPVQVVVLTVPVAGLARREDLVASGDAAVENLARVRLLHVFLQREVVAEAQLTRVALRVALWIGLWLVERRQDVGEGGRRQTRAFTTTAPLKVRRLIS